MLIFTLKLMAYDISHGRLVALRLNLPIFIFLLILWPNILACAIMRGQESMLPCVSFHLLYVQVTGLR